MLEFDLKKIPPCDRENIFIVNDNIDRLAWMIVDEDFDPTVPSENKLVTKSEIRAFDHKNYEEGDILFWDKVARKYVKFEDCLLEGELQEWDDYYKFLVEDLQVKKAHWDTTSRKNEEKKWLITCGVSGSGKKINANAEIFIEQLNDLLTKNSDKINFTAKKNHQVDYDRIEKDLKKSGLIKISHYQRAFYAAKRHESSTSLEYKFFQKTSNQINASAKFGASLSKSLGIEVFGKWSFLSDKKLSASIKIELEFGKC